MNNKDNEEKYFHSICHWYYDLKKPFSRSKCLFCQLVNKDNFLEDKQTYTCLHYPEGIPHYIRNERNFGGETSKKHHICRYYKEYKYDERVTPTIWDIVFKQEKP